MMTFAILGLIAFLGISLIPIYILRRRQYARARECFVASESTPGGVVQNSSIAYSLQIAAFAQFFSWGARGDFWSAIVCSAMFGTGLYLIYRLRRPMLLASAMPGSSQWPGRWRMAGARPSSPVCFGIPTARVLPGR